MKALGFEEQFEAGADLAVEVYWVKAHRPNLALKPVEVDLPVWIAEAFDRRAQRPGLTRPFDHEASDS